ncbi:activating transcription factor 7-interacting protein 1-like isoform X2 [Mercenaria mercenaria]|uniref:activating transcription factor 7-interacting protein 1-like isoform X2 n=1 Tax=Mercenaria mercenaria TaxID=6596 RepID=UPI00234F71AA|nr:activating transcription factor 7-interacting protein 1-like isoform X2 [Mercenaria mercenaria]
MEDVDEGFGSNESNHSNHKETILNDLKILNGQSVLDKNTNGKNIFNGNVFENCSKKVEESLDMNDGSEKDLDLREDKSNSSSQCIGFANALRGQHCEEKVEKTKSEELCYSYLSKDTLSPAENDNTNCSLKDKDNGLEESSSKSLSHDQSKENEIPNKCDDIEEECLDKTLNENHSNNLNPNSPIDKKMNGDLTTDVQDNELEKSCLDKIQNNEASPLNRTPIKQRTSSAEGAKSPFLLDDKVRNSLKGLVAKVKSSELSRGSMSPSGSSVSGDGEGPATLGKLQEVNSSDDISVEDEETEDHNNREEDAVNDFMDNTDENILADDEDGISMEIGSENEDDLLELASEHSSVKMCNNEKTETAILGEPSEKCNTQKSALILTAAEKEDTNSSSAVEIEITSDIEDDTVQDSDKEYKFKHDSVEKIQFEEDSNSNGNSGKINDIVNFLNRDLSGTNSPLLTSDNVVNDDSNSKPINNVLTETDNDNVENKDDSVVEMDEVLRNEKPDDDANSEMQIEEDTISKDRMKDNLDEKIKNMSSVFKEDGPSLGESQDVEQKLKGEEVENDEYERKDNDREILESKLHTEECNTGQIAELVSEKKVEENEDDDDDDVIFEGTTMPSMRNKYQRLPSSGSGVEKSDSVLKYSSGKSNNGIDANNESNDETVSKEEDDDVIFEKETKAENNKSKQNCDIVKTSDVRNDVNESIQTINSSPTLDNTNNNNSEEVHSAEKVSVIYSRNSSDRKRSAEDKEFNENESKRSRLDLTGLIGKLGSRVEPASIELSDDSEEEGDKSMDAETVTVTNKDENKKPEENERLITVTEKELEELVREKVKAYLTSQRDTLVAKLSQKVKELQQNNDLWKRQVKDLQVKVNDVTVLQQKLEKRKAATAALRQITTRNVAVQVDEGRTASSKTPKVSLTPPRVTTQLPLVTAPGGNGTIRLPIPQSSIAPAVLSTHLAQGSKMVTTTYQTPSVKSLLDTTRVQKTVGSLPSATTTVNTSMFGLLQYPATFVPKAATSQGLVQQTVTQVTTQTTSSVSKTVSVTKTVTLPSPNAAKVIDLTDDDDSTKTRLVTLQPGLNTVTNQQGVRHVLAPPGTQLVRTGLPNQPTYQLVFSSPPAIRPGMVMTVASTLPQTTTILQTVGQSQTLVNLSSPTAVAPGTTLARAAVPATPTTPKPPSNTHPAPFPALPPKQQTTGLKGLPPKPSLKISRVSQGIVLSWNMALNDTYAEISNYQLFAYQETSAQPVSTLWKKVGDVKALPLPMACTLTQFQVGNKYHFAVRAMDSHNRVGAFSDPGSIHLTPNTPTK